MRICFYTPFKPMDHAHPSGDLVIANSLYDYLSKQGYHIRPVSRLRSRWIFWKPWLWPLLLKEYRRIYRQHSKHDTDLWLTYHTYYKAPDLLGSKISRRMKIPYVIFQGIYATKRKRDWRTWPGYVLNKKALCAAHHVFTNRHEDWINLKRLVPEQRLTYVAPGIFPDDFKFDAAARAEMRRLWGVGDAPVVLTAAMFRPGIKAKGIALVIRACGELLRQGKRLELVIAGDGHENKRLRKFADDYLPGKVRFLGKVSRGMMHRFYSAGDVFAFPGIKESLGMVFLEAQSCGLPVVAYANGGIPEVVQNNRTGLLVPLYAFDRFVAALERLLDDRNLCSNMGRAAQSYVRHHHDLNINYRKIEGVLANAVRRQVG
jgi:glycosyltransferase involved in cell wall biosynthesis